MFISLFLSLSPSLSSPHMALALLVAAWADTLKIQLYSNCICSKLSSKRPFGEFSPAEAWHHLPRQQKVRQHVGGYGDVKAISARTIRLQRCCHVVINNDKHARTCTLSVTFALSLSRSLALPLSLFLYLSHSLSVSLSLFNAHTHSFSLTRIHTHTRTQSIINTVAHTHTHIFSLCLLHTHKQIYTHMHMHTHTRKYTDTHLL